MVGKILIFAPHVDDEVIGCFQLLNAETPEMIEVLYCDLLTDPKRREEAIALTETLGHTFSARGGQTLYRFIIDALERNPEAMVWAPDPHWELHPTHKEVGATVLGACRVAKRPFGTYTTSMNTPYLMELPPAASESKRTLLNRHFPSQATLWEADYRYWLFEGRCEWWIPGA